MMFWWWTGYDFLLGLLQYAMSKISIEQNCCAGCRIQHVARGRTWVMVAQILKRQCSRSLIQRVEQISFRWISFSWLLAHAHCSPGFSQQIELWKILLSHPIGWLVNRWPVHDGLVPNFCFMCSNKSIYFLNNNKLVWTLWWNYVYTDSTIIDALLISS